MQVSAKGRVTRSKSEWREILARFEKSNLSIPKFCNQEGILPSSFRRWKRKLTQKPRPSQFVPVTASRPASKTWALSITLPNGCELRFEG